MKYRIVPCLFALVLAACGNNNETNNTTNNATSSSNNATSSNGANNTTGSNNSNNTTGSNNSNNTTGSNNSNNTTGPAGDYIAADVDGVRIVASSEEGGVEPMGETVQLRKTTADDADGGSVLIFRIALPNADVASYDCANDDVTVTYSQLDGQLINNWVSMDVCSIEVTESGPDVGDTVAGTFSATTSDGSTTVALSDGEFVLTR